MVNKKNKSYISMTAPDITQYWCDKYYSYHNKKYDLKQQEISIIRKLLNEYGNYEVLNAIDYAINDNDTSIGYFSKKIESYITNSSYIKYYFLINNHGDIKTKELLVQLGIYENRLLPINMSDNKINDIISELDNFINNKKLS